MASNRQLKRSISLDRGLDTEDTDAGSFKPVTSRRSRRKVIKKAKLSGQSQGPGNNNSNVNVLITNTQSSQMSVDESQESQEMTILESLPSSQCVAAPLQQDAAVIQVEGNSSSPASELLMLRRTVDELKSTIQSYKLTVDKLTNQLNFVLSYLDINDNRAVANTSSSADETAVKETTFTTTGAAVATAAATTSYSNVAAAASARSGRSKPSSLKEAVVTAVNIEQREKERRAKTVVISGLLPNNSTTDAECFRRLSMLELGVDPSIKFTKRLGVAVGDRVQPLLIGLQSADQAADLIQLAKQLRRSTDEHVRTSVYINRNMTVGESKLAYEERCRRRYLKSQQHHTDSQHHSDNQQTQLSHAVSTDQSAYQSGFESAQPRTSRVVFNSHRRYDQERSDGAADNYYLPTVLSQSSTSNQRESEQQLTDNVCLVSGSTSMASAPSCT